MHYSAVLVVLYLCCSATTAFGFLVCETSLWCAVKAQCPFSGPNFVHVQLLPSLQPRFLSMVIPLAAHTESPYCTVRYGRVKLHDWPPNCKVGTQPVYWMLCAVASCWMALVI